MKESLGGRLFDLFNYIFLGLFGLVTILPFIYVVGGAFTSPQEYISRRLVLFPHTLSLEGFKYIFSTPVLLTGRCNYLYYGSWNADQLGIHLFDGISTVAQRFGRTQIHSAWRRFLDVVQWGMIPLFLVVKSLGMIDSFWSLLLPGAISAFNLIVLKNFFQQMPDGLEEAAKIDGCNDLRILWQIVLPLSLPAIATFSLFYAVNHWNSFFSAILYINDNYKWPIQVWLRQIVILSSGGLGDSATFDSNYIVPPGQIIKMAVIVISTVPILCVYPFLQKHFAKGALIGSVKG